MPPTQQREFMAEGITMQSSVSTAVVPPPLVAEVMRAMFELTPRGGYLVKPHVHHFHQLDVIASGRFVVQLENGKPFDLRRGDALLVPPLMRHAYDAPEPVGHVVFKFHIPASYWTVFGTRPLHGRVPPALLETIEKWSKRPPSDDRSPLDRHEVAAMVTMLLVEMARSAPLGTRAASTGPDGLDAFRQHLWPMLERIGNRPYEPWSIAAMAQEAGVSVPHFSRCFRKSVGQTPKQYLHASRMRAAASELVAEPAQPIKQVSRRAGYATVHAFTHAFKEFFGVSPGRYRKHPVTL